MGFHMPLCFFKDKSLGIVLKGLLMPWATFCCVLVLCSFIFQFGSNGSGPQFQFLDENCYILYHTICFLICLFICRLFCRLII